MDLSCGGSGYCLDTVHIAQIFSVSSATSFDVEHSDETDSMTITNNISEQLLTLDHTIRQTDNALKIARRRKKLSNLWLIFWPVLAAALYAMAWIPWISRTALLAIYIPAIPVAIGFGVASIWLKTHPGGPRDAGGRRPREDQLELELARQRDTRKLLLARADVPLRVRRLAYREDAHADIDNFRSESRGYRRVNNFLQGIVIVGALAATAASGVAWAFGNVRWVTLGLTFAVGISSGFMGYFKYKERSFYLQQTADNIESEWEAFDVGVGRYKRISNEEEALAEFVDEVHRLRTEQMKREQNLEQPPETRTRNE
jgi:Protein of unknown function (DUF4231)